MSQTCRAPRALRESWVFDLLVVKWTFGPIGSRRWQVENYGSAFLGENTDWVRASRTLFGGPRDPEWPASNTIIINRVSNVIFATRRRARRLPLPPGPKSWPIVGNLFDMPTTRPWETFCEWRKTYNSDIIFLDMPLQPILVVGSAKAALELLEKRSNLWSDRISLIIIELMSLNISTAFMPYGSRWRAHRRMFHQEFHPGVVEKYRPIQLDYARRFCSWVSKSPADTRKIVRQMVTGIIFFVAYGKRVSGMDDEAVITAQIASEGLSEGAMPGFSWLNYFPLARHIPSWVPGTYSKKLADKYLPYVQAMRDKPYDEVKAAFQMGVAPPSLAASLMERNRAKYGGTNEEGVHDETARNVAVLAYGAGADTTTSSCESFLLAIALFPEVQMKAQSELDRVIGPHRLPEFDDLENLPYVRAVVMETIRWIPVSPSGIPHVVVADDLYDGYHIPKGTAAIPNIWGMLHEPKDYPDPEKFWPDRFIGADGNIDPTVRDPSTIAFGFGRRVCLGRAFSNNTLAIFIATVLHVFDIGAGLDASDIPVELRTEVLGGLVVTLRDVPTGLKPRSASAVALITKFSQEIDMES